MTQPTIYADFHNADPRGRVRLNCAGTVADLARTGIVLREGLRIRLSDEELEAVGEVTFSTEEQGWVAVIDWSAVRPVVEPPAEAANRPPAA